MEFIEFEADQYINIRKLATLGVHKEQLRECCEQIYRYGKEHKYFTIPSFLADGMSTIVDELGFGTVFYESLLKTDRRFTRTRFGKTLVFSVVTEKIVARDILEELVSEAGFIGVDELLSVLEERFGIEMNRNGLLTRIKGTDLYYDKIMDYLYRNYDTYYQDI